MSALGFESDDGGAVVREIRPRFHLDGSVFLLQGAHGEGGVQAGAEIRVSQALVFGFDFGRKDGLLAAAARLHQRGVHLQNVREGHKLVHELLPDHLLDDVLGEKQTV